MRRRILLRAMPAGPCCRLPPRNRRTALLAMGSMCGVGSLQMPRGAANACGEGWAALPSPPLPSLPGVLSLAMGLMCGVGVLATGTVAPALSKSVASLHAAGGAYEHGAPAVAGGGGLPQTNVISNAPTARAPLVVDAAAEHFWMGPLLSGSFTSAKSSNHSKPCEVKVNARALGRRRCRRFCGRHCSRRCPQLGHFNNKERRMPAPPLATHACITW